MRSNKAKKIKYNKKDKMIANRKNVYSSEPLLGIHLDESEKVDVGKSEVGVRAKAHVCLSFFSGFSFFLNDRESNGNHREKERE